MKNGVQFLAILSLLLLAGCITDDPQYVCNDGKVVDDPALCPTVTPEPEPQPELKNHTKLLDEIEGFADREDQMLIGDSLIIDESKRRTPTKEGVIAIIQTYSAHADEAIQLYSEFDEFLESNKDALEEAEIDTTKVKADTLEEKLRIRRNLQVFKETIDELIKLSPGEIDLVNMRNKLTNQISQLPKPDYDALVNEYNELVNTEALMRANARALMSEYYYPEETTKTEITVIQEYNAQVGELIQLYSDLEKFMESNEADLKTAGIDTTDTKDIIITERQLMTKHLGKMRDSVDVVLLASPPNMELTNLRNQLTIHLLEIPEPPPSKYETLANEYQEFKDKEIALDTIAYNSLVEFFVIAGYDLVDPPDSNPRAVDVVVQEFSDNLDERISLYSDYDIFIGQNKADLETLGLDTTSQALTAEKSEVTQDHLRNMRDSIDVVLLASPPNMELTNLRNKLTTQISELD